MQFNVFLHPDSSVHHIFASVLGFLLSNEMCNVKIKLQKIVGNLLGKLRKLQMNGTVI